MTILRMENIFWEIKKNVMLQMCVRQIVRKLDYGFVQEGILKRLDQKKKPFQMKIWKRFKVECRMVKDKKVIL